MSITRKLIVKIALIVIQLSFIIAQNETHEIEYSQINLEKITSPLRLNSSSLNNKFSDSKPNSVIVSKKSKETGSLDALHKEIDTLTDHIIDFTESIKKYLQSAVPNSETNSRPRRSNPPPGFNPPTPRNDLEDIRTKLSDIMNEIRTLKNASDDSETRARFGSLELRVETLERTFDDAIRNIQSQVQNVDNFVTNLNTTTSNLKQEVDEIKQHFEALQLEKLKFLQEDVVQDIKGQDFENAAKKLYNLNGGLQKNINVIINKAYDDKAGNFYLILLFAEHKDVNVTTSLAVYRALSFELESNEHNDCMKVLKLIRSLDLKLGTSGLIEAQDFKNKLLGTVKGIIGRELTKATVSNNYTTVSEIFEKIYTNYLHSFNAVIKEALSSVIRHIDIEKLVNFFVTHKYVTQSILVYSAALNELKRKGSLDSSVVVTLAFGIKTAFYNPGSYDTYFEAVNLRHILPKSVRNLAFSTPVLIKNDVLDQYLYAASDGFKTGDFRPVFTWNHFQKVYEGVWLIEKKENENKFLIRNVRQNNESLCVFHNEHDDHNALGNVYTMNVGTDNDLGLFIWEFEPKGDNVYIKNALHNEYLFASIKKHDNDRRYVYTSKKSVDKLPSEWVIEEIPYENLQH